MNSRIVKLGLAAALATAFAAPVFAQTTVPATGAAASDVQRNVNQQQRIEEGLKSGQLNTREAGKLERGEAKIEKMEANAGKNGTVSAREQARITAAQNRESRAIYNQKHDAQAGNPGSASSQRVQADVQRNLNQQQRIEQGVKSGELKNGEVARLERGQSRVDRATARASADGRVGAHEQARIQAREDRQSARIYRKKHNAVVNG
ncbi:MAG: hypothetical protein ACR2GP_12325 [Burkholderiaceae bacterium]